MPGWEGGSWLAGCPPGERYTKIEERDSEVNYTDSDLLFRL